MNTLTVVMRTPPSGSTLRTPSKWGNPRKSLRIAVVSPAAEFSDPGGTCAYTKKIDRF